MFLYCGDTSTTTYNVYSKFTVYIYMYVYYSCTCKQNDIPLPESNCSFTSEELLSEVCDPLLTTDEAELFNLEPVL